MQGDATVRSVSEALYGLTSPSRYSSTGILKSIIEAAAVDLGRRHFNLYTKTVHDVLTDNRDAAGQPLPRHLIEILDWRIDRPSKQNTHIDTLSTHGRHLLNSMVTLSNTESGLINEIASVLTEVIEDDPNLDVRYANKTKVQKLLYLAIDEYDIPITYSWYLAGAIVPDRSIGPDLIDGPEGPMSQPSGPSGPDVSTTTEDMQIDNEEGGDADAEPDPLEPIMFGTADGDELPETSTNCLDDYVSRSELQQFFANVVPEVWHQQTMRFLQNFYQEEAPPEYHLLYIESTHLRTHLSETVEAVEKIRQGEAPDRTVEQLRKSIELSVSDLHFYLRQDQELGQTFNDVVHGTDLVEDALMKLDQLEEDQFSKAHVQALEQIQDFFYYYVWKYPCLLISQQTATGPNAEALKAERTSEFETFSMAMSDERSKLEDELEAVGLLPGPEDYSEFGDAETTETIKDLSSEYFE